VDGHAFDVPLFEELVGSHNVVELEDVESVCNALGYIERVFKLVWADSMRCRLCRRFCRAEPMINQV